MIKLKINKLLIFLGIEISQLKIRSIILNKNMLCNNNKIYKSRIIVKIESKIRIKNININYVSRSAFKLKKAIYKWPSKIKNRICLDIGASTGGFTEILLENNPKNIYTIDINYGQLAWKLRKNIKIINMERNNIFNINYKIFQNKINIIVIDISFISIFKVLMKIKQLILIAQHIYILIKPQFEISLININKGGLIHNIIIRNIIVNKILQKSTFLSYKIQGISKSPIKGNKGNIEYISALQFFIKKNKHSF